MANSSGRSVVDVGSVIADTYRLEGLIGRGGMGAVFLASHNRLPGKKVAIKVLHAELHDEELLARFRREAQIASMLGHPNIVGVHDFNVTPDGMPYLVLDYLEGETLAHKIARGPIPVEQVQSIIRQVGSALAAAHKEGIVHRDLKPQNIFLVPTEVDGKLVEIAKVLDFGISKWRGSQTVKTQESALLGTPQYMAPEQATGKHDSVDARTDVFALGVIVHEMLTGRPAFSGASIPEVVFKVVYEEPAPLPETVPAALVNAVKQAMSKPAEGRYATVEAFVEAITGQPMNSLRTAPVAPPEIGFATGSKRMTEQEALANTMGSGDYAGKVAVGTPLQSAPRIDVSAPTVDSQRGGVAPFAATVDSQRGQVGAPSASSTIVGVAGAPANTARSDVAASSGAASINIGTSSPGSAGTAKTASVTDRLAGAPPRAPAPKKKTGLIIGIAVACVAAGAAVAVVARGGKDKEPTTIASTPTQPPAHVQIAKPQNAAALPAEPTTPNARTTRAGSGSASASGSGPDAVSGSASGPASGAVATKPPSTKPGTKPKPLAPPPPPPEEPRDLGAAAATINAAVTAFRNNDHKAALRLTQEAINMGGPMQVARAHVLRGKIFCQQSDMEAYNVEVRALKGFGKHKRELEDYCNNR
ncbi:MAG: protein kinase [Kofleriaceae bacterium]|nr:protein kinase [Kofleriaceae bacterium]